jgi:hypothetical protein
VDPLGDGFLHESPPPGEAAPAAPRGDSGHDPTHAADRPECPVVRRLQGRVHARQPAVLLSADDHRLRQPLPADVRSAVHDAGALCLHRLRPHVPGIWAARGHSHRQRRPVRVTHCLVSAQQTGGVVAPRHSN